MSTKTALKAIRAALDSGKFAIAASQARELCQVDPKNYHVNVFLGLALDKLNNNDEAELAYKTAIKLKENDRTAWQGLINLYEKQGEMKLDSYGDVVVKLGQIFAATDDTARCHSIVDKYILCAKRYGSKSQYKQALELLLPSSTLYNVLEGSIPHPSHTYLRLIKISETEEREFINKEIGERRTRLGARIDQVTVEVKREAFERSGLELLYHGIIHWSNDDDIRRLYEEKLLKRACDFLQVLPSGKKSEKREEVLQLARDMVVIKHPFEFAWKIVLDWRDADTVLEWDIDLLKEFTNLFPDDGLSKVLQGILTSDLSPFPQESVRDCPEGSRESRDRINDETTTEDKLLLMAEGLEQTPASILSHRIMADLYLLLEDFQTAVDVARKTLEVIVEIHSETGLTLPKTVDAVNLTLATALISYQSPRNHPEARDIFQEILNRRPSSTGALLGIGIILEEDEDYAAAVDFLDQALPRDPANVKVRSELSWCKAHNGELEAGLRGLEQAFSMVKITEPRSQDLKSQILYRIGYCQWELNPSQASRKDRNGAYSSFLGSIQSNMNYAPAYTSLGIYYADYKKDKKRARRCFHKALELSPSEIEAAKRLAGAFADQGDWDLVEAVARRVVESGKAKPAPGSKRKGHSWPYSALGVVEINRQQHSKSIVWFQAALRISPEDYQSWVGLGESYHNSGRYIAATKALQHAETLETKLPASGVGQIWFARYMLANVKRELGEFEDAILRYEDVLKIRPNEFGVSIALLQTLVDSSWKSTELGLFGEAARTAARATRMGINIAKYCTDVFNLWKALGDAFAISSWAKVNPSFIPIADFKSLLDNQLDGECFQILADIDDVGANYSTLLCPTDHESPSKSSMYAALLAYKRAVSISSSEVHAQAVAWYNLGWAEYRAYACRDQSPSIDKDKQRRFLKASVRCFKRAIELEVGNFEFWNALGVVTTNLSPRVAQHAFVRSLYLNDRSAQVWTNLGALYLVRMDYQLSNEAFTRAQSADPDFSHAWLGQGLLALLFGDPIEARELFTHSFEISNSSLVLPKRQFSLSVFDHLISDPTMLPNMSQLMQPLFALHQLRWQVPHSLAFEHLCALFSERAGGFSDADASLEIVCSRAESEYEISESISALFHYAQARADLARVKLAQLDYEAAVDSAETALSLSSEEGTKEFHPEGHRKLRLSAHLTAGLAYYFLKMMDRAIDMFRSALQEADSAPDVVNLLAQVLWAKGGEEERNVAREQLFECVAKHPDHVGATAALSVIALLDADVDAIEAVESDLRSMRTRDDLDIHDRARVNKLLAAISKLSFVATSSIPEEVRLIQEATTSVMISPSQPDGWMALFAGTSELYPAEMALRVALQNIPPRGNLNARDLCKSYTLTGRRQGALRAIMVAPWLTDGWNELARSVSEQV